MNIVEKIQNLINKSNETTGGTDADLTTAVKSLINGYGGGGGPVTTGYRFKLLKHFPKSNITESEWTSTDGETLEIINGFSIDDDGSLKLDGGYINMPIPNSSVAIAIRCKITSYPSTAINNWYQKACIIGCELGGTQKDYGCVINTDGEILIGYSTSSTQKTDSYVDSDNYQDIILLGTPNFIMTCVDGIIGKRDYTWSGSEITTMGIFWNKSNASLSRISGNIESIKVYSYEFVMDGIKDLI